MKNNFIFPFFLFLIVFIFCESFDYVYIDDNKLRSQLSYLKNGYVAVVLQIDPKKEDISTNYAAPGKIIKEKVFKKESMASSELIRMVLEITRKKYKYSGDEWHPTYMMYIKFTDRFFFIIPIKKYLSLIFDFNNSILFIEGRKFIFDEKEAKILKKKLDCLLNMP
jgi:hypothetical protein